MIILKYIVDLSIYPKVSLRKPPCLNAQGAIQKRADCAATRKRGRAIYWIIMRTFTSPTTTGDYPLPDGVFKEQTNIMLCKFQYFFI